MLSDLIAKHKKLVADAKAKKVAAAAVLATETQKYKAALADYNKKEAAYQAALVRQTKEGDAARKLSQGEISDANKNFDFHEARIDGMAADDKKYINAELAVVAEVEAVLKELNIL